MHYLPIECYIHVEPLLPRIMTTWKRSNVVDYFLQCFQRKGISRSLSVSGNEVFKNVRNLIQILVFTCETNITYIKYSSEKIPYALNFVEKLTCI